MSLDRRSLTDSREIRKSDKIHLCCPVQSLFIVRSTPNRMSRLELRTRGFIVF